MEMHQVRYFLAVADELNFSRAAEKCNVSRPSLSRAIQLLEGEFGGQLFRREYSRTQLSELGKMVRPYLPGTPIFVNCPYPTLDTDIEPTPLCTENLNPNVAVMKPTEDRL